MKIPIEHLEASEFLRCAAWTAAGSLCQACYVWIAYEERQARCL